MALQHILHLSDSVKILAFENNMKKPLLKSIVGMAGEPEQFAYLKIFICCWYHVTSPVLCDISWYDLSKILLSFAIINIWCKDISISSFLRLYGILKMDSFFFSAFFNFRERCGGWRIYSLSFPSFLNRWSISNIFEEVKTS